MRITMDTGMGCKWNVVMMEEIVDNQRTLMLVEGQEAFARKHGFTPGCVDEFEIIHPGYMKVKLFGLDDVEMIFGTCAANVGASST